MCQCTLSFVHQKCGVTPLSPSSRALTLHPLDDYQTVFSFLWLCVFVIRVLCVVVCVSNMTDLICCCGRIISVCVRESVSVRVVIVHSSSPKVRCSRPSSSVFVLGVVSVPSLVHSRISFDQPIHHPSSFSVVASGAPVCLPSFPSSLH